MRKNPKPNPNTYKPKSDWASLKRLILRGSDACYLWRLCFFQTVRRHGLEHPRGIVDRRVTEFVKVRKSPEDLPRVIGRGLCDLSSRGIRWGLGVLDCVSRTGCPGLCVLRFKYLAALTRCTTETAVGTGLTNHCLHQAYWFYFLNSFISSYLCCVLVHICLKTLTEDFLNFLSSISSVCLSSSCVILWLRFLYSVFVFISSWWPCLYSVMFTSEYLFRCK